MIHTETHASVLTYLYLVTFVPKATPASTGETTETVP